MQCFFILSVEQLSKVFQDPQDGIKYVLKKDHFLNEFERGHREAYALVPTMEGVKFDK